MPRDTRECMLAVCKEPVSKGEKVVAYQWYEKAYPYETGTYVTKFSDSKKLNDGENCRKTETRSMKIYNIGEYKVMSVLGSMAKIAVWTRFDE